MALARARHHLGWGPAPACRSSPVIQPSPLPTPVAPPVPESSARDTGASRRERRLCAGHVVLAIVTLFICWYPYPGRMNNDTLYQIAQVRSGHIEDLHAWPLQVLWHPLYSLGLHAGPAYVGSILVFSFSAYVILRWTLSRNAASIFLSVVMLTPPLLAQLQAFNKDSWLLIFVLAATACIGQAVRGTLPPRTQTLLMVTAVACIWLAAGARTNGLVLALPLSIPIGFWVERRRRPQGGRSRSAWRLVFIAGLSAVVLIVGVVGSQQVLRRIANVKPAHVDSALYAYDLASISVLEHRVLLPASVFPSQNLALLEGRHVVGNIDPILFADPVLVRWMGLDDAQREELRQDWVSAIKDHPVTYARSRLTMLTKMLGFSGTPYDVVGDHAGGNSLHIEPVFPWAVDAVDHYTHWGTYNASGFFEEGPFYFKPWPYFLLLAAAAALAWFGRLARHIRDLTTCLVAGSLLYAASFAVLSPAAVYRYLFPCVVLAVLSAPVAFRGTVSWRRERASVGHQVSGELDWQS